VRAAAEQLGAQFVSLKVVCPPGANLEARARAARFAALPQGVATGHTADDQAETVLLNMLRGASLDGLSAMAPGPTHPILGLRRAEGAELVSSLGFVAIEDPSNNDPSFRRNRVRHELLGLMCDISGRDLVPVLTRQAGLMRDDAELLDALAANVDATDVMALRELPASLARRAIRGWLRSLDPSAYIPDAAAIERILSVARGEIVACEITAGRRIRRSHGRLICDR
jgi:tRNA(Ile)-lysidine synthase